MGDIYTGRQIAYGVAEESTFKTPVTDAGPFEEIAVEGGVTINPDVKHQVAERMRGQRVDDILDVFNDNYGAMPGASLKMPALRGDLALWFYSMFQNVIEGATPDYAKVFTFPANTPDFKSDEGFFMTIIGKSPVAVKSERLTSAIGQKLVLSCSAEGDFARLYASLDVVGALFSRISDPSGTWTPTPRNYFPFHNLQLFEIDSNAVELESFSLTITNNVMKAGFDGAGSFGNLVITKHDVEFEAVGIWDSALDSAGVAAKFDSGAETNYQATFGTAGQTGHLDILGQGVVSEYAILEEDKRKASVKIKGASVLSVPDEILTVTLGDGVVRTWPTS